MAHSGRLYRISTHRDYDLSQNLAYRIPTRWRQMIVTNNPNMLPVWPNTPFNSGKAHLRDGDGFVWWEFDNPLKTKPFILQLRMGIRPTLAPDVENYWQYRWVTDGTPRAWDTARYQVQSSYTQAISVSVTAFTFESVVYGASFVMHSTLYNEE